MRQIDEVLHRLQTASDLDRDIDADIWEIFHGNDMYWSLHQIGSRICLRYYPGPPGPEYYPLPKYTTSLEAALTLVPKDWQWMVENRAPPPQKGRAYINNGELHFQGIALGGPGGPAPNKKYRGFETTAVTPALALCIVCLQAFESINAPSI